jgi:polyisoprenoid-binding protein YceI
MNLPAAPSMIRTFVTSALAAAAFGSAAEPSNYAIDPTHTFVMFEVLHYETSTNRGRFDKKRGTIQVDRAERRGKADITFDTAAVSTGTLVFDRQLQSRDFLNSVEFPTARFVSDEFVFDGERVSALVGQFTLLGKTLPLTLKAIRFNCYENPQLKREVCGGDFETTFQRSQWGMTWGLDFGFPDTVHLLIQIEAIKQ